MYMYKIDICSVTLLDKCFLFYLIFLLPLSNKCSLVCLIYVQSRPVTTRMLGGSNGSEEEEEDIEEVEGTIEWVRGSSQRSAKGLSTTFSPLPSDSNGAQPALRLP
jgi:hypothetical protein